MRQGQREGRAYITVSNPRTPSRAHPRPRRRVIYLYSISVRFASWNLKLRLQCQGVKKSVSLTTMSIYLFVWSSVPPTLGVLINVTMTWTTHFGSRQSRLMPAWFSTLSISERVWRKAHSRALAYGLYSLIVLLIYIFTVILLWHVQSVFGVCSRENKPSVCIRELFSQQDVWSKPEGSLLPFCKSTSCLSSVLHSLKQSMFCWTEHILSFKKVEKRASVLPV